MIGPFYFNFLLHNSSFFLQKLLLLKKESIPYLPSSFVNWMTFVSRVYYWIYTRYHWNVYDLIIK